MDAKRCEGRCSGCALKRGSVANSEIVNRLTGVMAAMGGVPFYCHEALGWTPDQPDYPGGKERVANAVKNLMSAPTLVHNSPGLAAVVSDATATGLPQRIFDSDRAIISRTPVCQSWRAAVFALQETGWFKDPVRRAARRITAAAIIGLLDRLQAEKSPVERKAILSEIGRRSREMAKEMRLDAGGLELADLEAD